MIIIYELYKNKLINNIFKIQDKLIDNIFTKYFQDLQNYLKDNIFSNINQKD